MRALALLLLVLPVAAAAQSTPAPHKVPAHAAPHAPTHGGHAHIAKPGPAKPGPTKPAPAKPPPAPAPAPEKPAEPKPHDTKSGLPVPRFASLGADTVNCRVGPDEKFPIKWVYKRKELPVEILRDYNNWRLIEDPDGDKGWVHVLTLTSRRSAVVSGGMHVLRDGASETSAAVAKLEKGVIVRLRSCAAGSDWCRVAAGGYAGYLRRDEIWGLLPGEVIQ